MTLALTRPIQDNRILRETGDLSTTLGSGLSAIWQAPLSGGLVANQYRVGKAAREGIAPRQIESGDVFMAQVSDLGQQFEAATDDKERDAIYGQLQELKKTRGVQISSEIQRNVDEGRMRAPDDLNEEYGQWGLKFDRPMSTSEAKILYENKKAEVIRGAIISRSPSGVLATGAKFAVGLAATAVDPLEFASMFIPVVGPARKAMLLSRFGRVGGRVAIGATEGFVGSLITEPFFYALSKQQQLDYTMYDSLLNITLGTAFGTTIGLTGGLLARRRDARAARISDAIQVETPDVSIKAETPAVKPTEKPVDLPARVDDTPTRAEIADARQATDIAIRQFVNDQNVDVSAITRGNTPIIGTMSGFFLRGQLERDFGSDMKSWADYMNAQIKQTIDRGGSVTLHSDGTSTKVDAFADGAMRDKDGNLRGVEDLLSNQKQDAPAITFHPPVTDKAPRTDSRGNKVSSWVVVDNKTGEAVREIQLASIADKVNRSKYTPVPVSEYLGDINQAIKRGADPAVTAETLARNAQKPSPQSSPELAKMYDDFVGNDFSTESYVQAEIEMNSRMVDQVELTPEQKQSLDDVADMEAKAKAYSEISNVAAACMARK